MPSTPTEALLDVNLVIAAVFADHVMHRQALNFIEVLEQFHTTPMIHRRIASLRHPPLEPPRLTMAAAQTLLREFTAAKGHVFLPDDAPFTELGMRSMQGHRQWTDAYLLHLARKHGLTFASLESRMSNLDDATHPVLFVVV